MSSSVASVTGSIALDHATAQAGVEPGASLTLGIAPVVFSAESCAIGRLDPATNLSLAELRRAHGRTHAFRFDARDNTIKNVGLAPGIEPLGTVETVKIADHLLLFGEAIQHQLRSWFAHGRRRILRPFHPLVCLGAKDCLLTKALSESGAHPIDRRLDVVAKWSFEVRMLASSDPERGHYLGLLTDVGTSNVLDIPVSELLQRGFDPTGYYVGTLGEVDDLGGFSALRTIGRIKVVQDGVLLLEDVRHDAGGTVAADKVYLEPRRETVDAVAQLLYGRLASTALQKLRRTRAQYMAGDGKLRKIAKMIDDLNDAVAKKSLGLTLGDGLHMDFGRLLNRGDQNFPLVIETSRPKMLFGASGHDQEIQPDLGIQRNGPFQYTHNPINDPMIVVLSDRQARGRMDEFCNALRVGSNEDNGRYKGGLIGKFRLTNVRFHFVEIDGDTADAYAAAATRALEELPQTPALALVQVREAHKRRIARENPYYAAKASFMRSSVPVQAVRLETIESPRGRGYTLNNVALASYAKIGGVPWVISTRGVATHELVIGIGSTEVGEGRLGQRKRYVGITALFQGDGRYLVWETTREAAFEEYPDALLQSLRNSIRFVRTQNRWEAGDNVRLVFHAYKPLKRVEIETAKTLVKEMLNEHSVEFAFLDVSHHHAYQVFDPLQQGSKYWSAELGRKETKGMCTPERGLALLLNRRTALLQLVGTHEVKTWDQGIPRPLLLELHPDSDFSDLTYLVRQAYHFSFMSWRSFFPSHEPVTILYSRWIANLLGNLRSVPEWDSVALNQMRDRRAMWHSIDARGCPG